MKRHLKSFIAAVLALFMLLAAAAALAAENGKNGGPFEKIIGDVRVQILSDSLLRLEKKGEKGFSDHQTIAVLNKADWPGAEVKTVEKDGKIILAASEFAVVVPEKARDLSEVSVTDNKGNEIWKFEGGMNANVFLPAPAETPAAWSFNDAPRVTPSADPFKPGNDDDDDLNGWTYEKDVQDCYVFITGGDPFKLREDFVKLTGQSDLVPLKALGLWFSRYHAYTDKEFLALIDAFRKNGYPIDMLVIDTDWRKSDDGTGYTVNTDYFPDIKGFFKKAKEKNVLTLMNDHVRNSQKSMLSKDQLEWFNKGIRGMIDNGLDAWWYDRNWVHKFVSPFEGIHGDLLGQFLYHTISADEKPKGVRPFLMSNIYSIRNGNYGDAPHVSLHRNSIQWTGDIASSSKALRNEVENMIKNGYQTSLGYYSSDIGGHTGDPNNNMFVRWTQYGALSPIMRYHSTASVPSRIPFEKIKQVNEICREYIRMRYRMMPLFYTLAWENHEKGLPLVRRLDFYYPEHEESQANDQYLLGKDILIAPLFGLENAKPVPAAWLTTKDGKPGIEAKFYANQDLKDKPVYELTVPDVNFNWGTGSPNAEVPVDHFSGIFEGRIKIGEKDGYLGFTVDDGARLYLDGKLVIDQWKPNDSVTFLMNSPLKAGSTHDIKLEYYEDTGNAVIKLVFNPVSETEMEKRSVFIPDGEWINAFTGDTVKGPKTVEVSMPDSQSPIFIKKGSLTVLTKPGEFAEAKDWKNLVLDVYPGKDTENATLHYEDDGTSTAYLDGGFRLTNYDLKFDKNGGMTLKASVAQNGGDPIGFEKRDVTLRLHQDHEPVVELNGKALKAVKIAKDADAYPFAVEGGSPDGDVYEIAFTVNPGEDYTLTAR